MEAGAAASDSTVPAMEISGSAAIATAESSEIFSYRHENGEVASGTLADLARCAMLGSLPEEQRAILARQFMIGQQELQANEEQNKEEAKENQDDQAEEIGQKTENSTAKTETATEDKMPKYASESKREELIKSELRKHIENQTSAAYLTGFAPTESAEKTVRPEGDSKKSSLLDLSLETDYYDSTVDPKGEKAIEDKSSVEAISSSAEADAVNNKLDLHAPYTAGRNEALPFSEDFPLPKQFYESRYPDKVIGAPEELRPDVDLSIDDNLAFQLEAVEEISKRPVMREYELELTANIYPDLYSVSEQENFNENLRAESWFEGDEMTIRETPDKEDDFFTPDDLLHIAGKEVPGLEASIQQIEETAEILVDRLNEWNMQEDESAFVAILDEIIQKIELNELGPSATNLEMKIEEQDDKEIEGIEPEIEKLFIRLFDLLEIDYSPELIHSFVNLSMKYDDRILYKKKEENLPDEAGTHEIIDNIFVAFSSIKKTLLQACVIGRSALQLCFPQSEVVT